MINLSNGAGAFLLMKRSGNRKIAPGVWSFVGGKMERDELNDPQAACLREIEEETGISAAQIRDLTLRYVIIRRHCDTIRQTHVYFGETDADPSITTDEGELSWVLESELLDRTYTKTFTAMLRHYLTTPDPERVIVGAASAEVAYLLGKAWWGRGIMTEALSEVLKFLFEEVGIYRVWADYALAAAALCGNAVWSTKELCGIASLSVASAVIALSAPFSPRTISVRNRR